MIEKIDFDIIISDLKMSIMDGYDLGNWIKANKNYLLKKFILAAGIIDNEVEDYCKKNN